MRYLGFRSQLLAAGVAASFFFYTHISEALAYQPLFSDKTVGSSEIDLKQLKGTEESESLWEFFKRRTKLGVGFEEQYNSNVFYQDNNRQNEYISVLQNSLLFADIRGAFLYAAQSQVFASWYHRLNINSIDNNLTGLIDFDPGGRIQSHLEYNLVAQNHLVLESEGTNLFRRSTGFQRTVEHVGSARFRYALNETNALVPKVEYSVFDDQSVNDATTDRRQLSAILDLDHDLTPTWTLFGGYSFQDIRVPGEKTLSAQIHGARLGIRHDLGEAGKERLEATFELQRAKYHRGKIFTSPSFSGTWTHELGPRTSLKLGYSDKYNISFSSERLRFRDRIPSAEFLYELTPLLNFKLEAKYSKQTSGNKDIPAGSPPSSEVNKYYSFTGRFTWKLREQTQAFLEYKYQRSPTRDYTSHVVELNIATTF